MILKKSINLGKFAKLGEDFRDGSALTILSEGTPVDGKFGRQIVFRVKLPNGDEKNLAFNATSQNKLIEAYGEETKQWIDKPCYVWAINQVVQGNMRKIVYLTSNSEQLPLKGMEESSVNLGV